MTKREVAFLFLGVGSGLLGVLAFIGFPEIFFFVFIWRHGLLMALFLSLTIGFVILLRLKIRAKSTDSN